MVSRLPPPDAHPPPGVNGYLIEQDLSDAWLWTEALGAIPKLGELRTKGEGTRPGAGSLLRDLFLAFFKAKPVLRGPKTPSQQVRHRILASILECSDFRRLRGTTRLRALPAAVAAAELFEKLLASWPDNDRPSQAGAASDAAGDRLDALVRQLLRAAAAKAEEVVSCVELWGTAPGQVAHQGLAEAAALAERVQRSDLLRRLALLAGRVKQVALARHRTRVRHGTDEIVSIESGRDLSRVLPQELVALRHPVLRREFFRRFAEGALLQYQLEGRECLGRGPVIVCLDSSGSMRGDREAWAKAVALALLHVAAAERRDFALIHFGSSSELRVFRFQRGHAAPDQVVEALGFAFHGGTDFEAPLREATGLVQESRFNAADVVFLTDGACELSPAALDQLLAVKAKRQVRIFSVLIDLAGTGGGGPSSARTLVKFSDEVVRLTDLSADAAVLDRLFGRS